MEVEGDVWVGLGLFGGIEGGEERGQRFAQRARRWCVCGGTEKSKRRGLGLRLGLGGRYAYGLSWS